MNVQKIYEKNGRITKEKQKCNLLKDDNNLIFDFKGSGYIVYFIDEINNLNNIHLIFKSNNGYIVVQKESEVKNYEINNCIKELSSIILEVQNNIDNIDKIINTNKLFEINSSQLENNKKEYNGLIKQFIKDINELSQEL